MLKKLIYLCLLCFSVGLSAQGEQLAQNYFDRGEFEKALLSYEELLKIQPGSSLYFQRVVESHQQLSQFAKAEAALLARLERYRQPAILVELGYNYQLQKNDAEAKKYYDLAIEKIRENPSNVYSVATTFERRVVLKYALDAYELAVQLEPKFNFNLQVALLHGQLGNTDLMIGKFLDESYKNPQSLVSIQYQLSRFMNEHGGEHADSESAFNNSLRKALLVRAQQTQDVFWNDFLSWYFVQHKEYGKAFIQQKAIYKREPDAFSSIVSLAELAMDEGDNETATEIFSFVLENTMDAYIRIQAYTFLMRMKVEKASEKDHDAISAEFERLLQEFGVTSYSLPLQTLQASFLTFQRNNPEQSKKILRDALELRLNKYEVAEVKMQLADVFLYEQKFNQALIYYSQIEDELKNDEVGHEASLKAAKTSYFKGDFDWAQKQFKTLKSASSQLIANDALEYFMLINDNTVSDSTQVDLKRFARADYLVYQNKLADALSQFQEIVKTHVTEEIMDVTTLRIGRIYEKTGDFVSALAQYQTIIDTYKEGIYVDEALWFSAGIYQQQLNDSEKAKQFYERILFNHQDSIYFIESRKRYRQLRGDNNL